MGFIAAPAHLHNGEIFGEQGKGRRTAVDSYRLQRRGGKGMRNYPDSGRVAAVRMVKQEDDVILISLEGIIIRMHTCDIAVQSRYGSGVRVMRLGEGDRIVTVARAERDDDAETAAPEAAEQADLDAEAALAAREEDEEADEVLADGDDADAAPGDEE